MRFVLLAGMGSPRSIRRRGRRPRAVAALPGSDAGGLQGRRGDRGGLFRRRRLRQARVVERRRRRDDIAEERDDLGARDLQRAAVEGGAVMPRGAARGPARALARGMGLLMAGAAAKADEAQTDAGGPG